MAERVFEYPECGLRRAAHRVCNAVPPLRPISGAVWAPARRADHLRLDERGLTARSLTGIAQLEWHEVVAVRREAGHKTVLVVEGGEPWRTIEIASSLPGFETVAQAVHERAGVAELIELADHRDIAL